MQKKIPIPAVQHLWDARGVNPPFAYVVNIKICKATWRLQSYRLRSGG